MKICDCCGKEYQDYLQECPTCHATDYRIKENKAESLSNYRVCRTCGEKYDSNNKVCPHCGSKESIVMNSNTQHIYMPIKESNQIDDGSFVTGFLLTLFLGIIPVIFILYSDKRRTSEGSAAALIVDLILGIIIFFIRLLALAAR